MRLAQAYDERAGRGEVPTIDEFRAQRYDGEDFIRRCAEHLRATLAVVQGRVAAAAARG